MPPSDEDPVEPPTLPDIPTGNTASSGSASASSGQSSGDRYASLDSQDTGVFDQPPPPADVPSQIGKYRILGVLAETRLSIIYRAEDTAPQRQVVLKFPRGIDLASPEAHQRMREEVALAARLDQQAVVPILETGEIDRVPYYVMPLLHGQTLTEHVQGEAMDLEERIDLFHKLCRIVASIHRDGILHLDLKPANFLIDRHGEPRLLDFGLAATQEELRRNPPDHISGTLRFMAPEQTYLERIPELTAAADVHALGTIFYQLLTDQYPYPLDGNMMSAIESIRRALPKPPSQANPRVPPRFDALVNKALHKDPSQRFPDAGAMASALSALRQGSATASVTKRSLSLPVLAGGGLLAAGALALGVLFWPEQNEGASAALARQIQVSTYDSAALADFSEPAAPVTRLPEDLWGLYRHVHDTLQSRADLRLAGAIIVDARQLPASTRFHWRDTRETEHVTSQPFRVGDQVATIFVPAGFPIELTLINDEDESGPRTQLLTFSAGRIEIWRP
ncbi:serine/threonine protein kinase [Actomonas aquatica]|uniref:Serine/threonine-protein kinase n=1 Tax=Actomonas aquatica TaxID=2866162 RepID=A0ABZ1C5Q8_9BACT|nr:serine/threonine-protein kinase [Opitutus sp. WL0086]WRQ86662.1 serine/threonine-protein kinase [Opitutus sp. WL0086]